MILQMTANIAGAPARVVLFVVLAIAGWAMLFTPSVAAATTDAAAAFVRNIGDKIVDTIEKRDLDSEQRQTELRKVFTDVFDVQGVAKFVMGRHWRRMSDAQRQRYLDVMPRYVASIYAQRFDEYSGQTLEVVKSDQTQGGDTVVYTRIVGNGQQPIDVAIRVTGDEGKFRIEDVRVQGVSLLVTKRDEFDSFLSRNDVDALIGELERRAGK